MRTFLIAALLAATSFTPALAQNGGEDRAETIGRRMEGVFGRRSQGDAGQSRNQRRPDVQTAPAPAPQVQAQAPAPQQSTERGGWRRGGGNWTGGEQNRGRANDGQQNGEWRGGWRRGGNDATNSDSTQAQVFGRQRWGNRGSGQVVPTNPNPPVVNQNSDSGRRWEGNRTDHANRDRHNGSGRNRTWENRNGENRNWENRTWQNRTWGDRTWGNRTGNRNHDGRLDRRHHNDRDYAYNNGGYNNRHSRDRGHNWNRGWRNDNRYDWYGYRNRYNSYYQLPRYSHPYGSNYGYRSFSIGAYIDSLFYSSRYWINDPWSYRLPSAPYGYRWVRYYDDVLLVDMRDGEVVDVIRNFFW
jgi:hypothetical protein